MSLYNLFTKGFPPPGGSPNTRTTLDLKKKRIKKELQLKLHIEIFIYPCRRYFVHMEVCTTNIFNKKKIKLCTPPFVHTCSL